MKRRQTPTPGITGTLPEFVSLAKRRRAVREDPHLSDETRAAAFAALEAEFQQWREVKRRSETHR